MRIGAFELNEPVPELKDPLVLAILRPWIDVNNVGSLVLRGLEAQFGARELGRLAKPGLFFDFTRYRPTVYYERGIRRMKVPNTILSYAKRDVGNDLLFLSLLEPHGLSEFYVDSVLKVLERLHAKQYCLLGSMYDAVPHTRPLIVYGGAQGRQAEADFTRSGCQRSSYQGPSTFTFFITQRAPEFGMEATWFIVALPQYVSLEEDHVGKVRLLEILNLLYHIPIDPEEFKRAAEQRKVISQRVENVSELKGLLPQLETLYELRMKQKDGEKTPQLSSEVEEMLWKIIGKDFGKA